MDADTPGKHQSKESSGSSLCKSDLEEIKAKCPKAQSKCTNKQKDLTMVRTLIII